MPVFIKKYNAGGGTRTSSLLKLRRDNFGSNSMPLLMRNFPGDLY